MIYIYPILLYFLKGSSLIFMTSSKICKIGFAIILWLKNISHGWNQWHARIRAHISGAEFRVPPSKEIKPLLESANVA